MASTGDSKMYRLTLTLVRNHTEQTGRDTRRRQVRKITLKALVSAQTWDWESAFELANPIPLERGWQLLAKVVYTFVGARDPGREKIEQDKDAILTQMDRICRFDIWKKNNWNYSDVKLEVTGGLPDCPAPEVPLSKTAAVLHDLSGFEYHYQVMASPRTG
jgi:hypothetical protein